MSRTKARNVLGIQVIYPAGIVQAIRSRAKCSHVRIADKMNDRADGLRLAPATSAPLTPTEERVTGAGVSVLSSDFRIPFRISRIAALTVSIVVQEGSFPIVNFRRPCVGFEERHDAILIGVRWN